MKRVALAVAVSLIAVAANAETQGAANPGFEQLQSDGTPAAWLSLRGPGMQSFTSTKGRHGKGGRLRVSGGAVAIGSVAQKIDAAPYRGKLVRLTATFRTAATAQVGPFLTILRPTPYMVGFAEDDSMRPARPGKWQQETITGRVAQDATAIWIGVKVVGDADVTIDDVRLEEPSGHGKPPTPVALAYLDQAIAILRAHHINSANADWPRLISEAHAEIAGAKTSADTYSAIADLIEALGERHSFLQPPPSQAQIDAAAHPRANGVPQGVELPSETLLDGRVGVVRMPGLNLYAPGGARSAEVYQETLRAALLQLDKAPLCGWIVDLRNNTGGDMWPMLNGLDPLLGSAPFGYVVDKGGKTAWERVGGRIGVGQVVSDPQAPPAFVLRHASTPVGILLGPRTASSGEITALALIGRPRVRTFGAPSAGFLSANIVVPMSDGANLAVTTSLIADRSGAVYSGTIQPDVVTDPDFAEAAAKTWIEQQCVK